MDNNNALNYLGILLNDIEQSKNNLSSYNNLLLILSMSHGVNDNPMKLAKLMNDGERNAIIQTVGLFRTYATRAYIGYTSIKQNFTKQSTESKDTIEETYSKIKSQAIPDYDDSEKFVQLLSNLFVEEINVQALINTSQKTESLAQSSASPNLE